MNKKILPILITLLIALVSILFFMTNSKLANPVSDEITPELVVLPTPAAKEQVYVFDPYFDYSHEELKEINDRYVGKITVGSLIHEVIVHSKNNADYLDYNLEKKPNGLGTVFMDYQNKKDLNDQNIILYGHYVYYDDELKFTPLYKMMSQDIFDENKYITLELIDETRYYEVVSIHYYELGSTGKEYDIPNYTESYFDSYIAHVEKNNRIKSDERLSYEDNILTLQTCVRDRDDLRLIVIAKQLSKNTFETIE